MSIISSTIITIGDELLIGQVADTNSAWIAQRLNQIGVWVRRHVSVGDVWDDIWQALDTERKDSNIILITGGLGPTADDITKPLLSEYFGGRLMVNAEALANVKYIFEKVLNRPMLERNLKQAEVPEGCRVILNKGGTAPGMWFEKNDRVFISLPGVPYEMKGMMEDWVLPALQQHFKTPYIGHKTLLAAGIGESFLAERISAFEQALPPHIKLAYLPNFGMVRLRLTARGEDKNLVTTTLESSFAALKHLVTDWLVTDKDSSMQEVLGKLLLENKYTISTAESCTGGYIAHLITAVPGASRYFKGSVVAYSNQIKENLLHLSPDMLEHTGAVSEDSVRQMLAGVLESFQTDVAIATSGIMGPDGGSKEKPVGTVWVAVGKTGKITAQKFFFRFDRLRNIELASTYAMNMLRKFIVEESTAQVK